MPLPRRKEGETEPEFTQRCMSDPEVVKEFPLRNQRMAVCKTLFTDEKGKKWKMK